jgi:hypothetical protein
MTLPVGDIKSLPVGDIDLYRFMSPTGNVTNWQFSQLPVGDINLCHQLAEILCHQLAIEKITSW